MDALVSTEWLAGEIGKSDLRVVDASLFLAADNRDAKAEFEAAHIPGAVFFDIEEIADTSSPYPSMLPSSEKFASRMQSLGLGDGSRIVVYDNSPYHSAARAWWMLSQVFGAHEVAILDGGFAKWQSEGRQTESGKPVVRHRHFTALTDLKPVRTLSQMVDNLRTKAEQVIDARSASRYAGSDPEREGVRPGHMPGSKNLPQGNLFNSDGTWKQGDELRAAFTDAGVDLDKGIITTCGSGITAAVLTFGLHLLGKKDTGLYDGSWTEWGSQADTPVVTGAA